MFLSSSSLSIPRCIGVQGVNGFAFWARLLSTLKLLALWLLCLLVSHEGAANGVLRVHGVRFEQMRESEWVRCRIEVEALSNPLQQARDPKYLDDLVLSFHLSYSRKAPEFEFFTSKVEIVSLKVRERYDVDFFLPGIVLERGQFPIVPFAYLLEFTVSGIAYPFEASHASSSIAGNEAARQSLRSRATAESNPNHGVLLSYPLMIPFVDDRPARYPAFKRR
jgi:hypothetical protein